MVHEWRDVEYDFKGHNIHRLYALYEYGPVEEMPLDRYKCMDCRKTFKSIPEIRKHPECRLNSGLIGSVIKLLRKH